MGNLRNIIPRRADRSEVGGYEEETAVVLDMLSDGGSGVEMEGGSPRGERKEGWKWRLEKYPPAGAVIKQSLNRDYNKIYVPAKYKQKQNMIIKIFTR